jgi:hypothetical protein
VRSPTHGYLRMARPDRFVHSEMGSNIASAVCLQTMDEWLQRRFCSCKLIQRPEDSSGIVDWRD